MELYYDKHTKKIMQDDKRLDLFEPERYERHESILYVIVLNVKEANKQ